MSTNGGLAQLARASALHAEGQRFESVILHQQTRRKDVEKRIKLHYKCESKTFYDIMEKIKQELSTRAIIQYV